MSFVAPRFSIVGLVMFAMLASIAGLPAQKIALAGDSERVVVVLDVHDLLPAHRGDPAVLVKAPADPTAAIRPTDLERLAAFMRTFVVPQSEPGADLRPLGDRHVVVLGTPVQTAAAERWLARAHASLDKHYQIDLRLCEVPAAVFDRLIAPRLRQPTAAAPDRATRATTLDNDAERTLTESLRESGVTKFTQFPQPIAPSLTMARLKVGEHLSYVKDFTLEVAAAAFVAAPVTEVVFDGHDVDVFCGETGDGTIGLQLQLLDQTVEKPIREVKTTLPGSTKEVTVQVPRIAGCRASQSVELPSGGHAVLAARKDDATWLVLRTTVREVQWAPEGPPQPRR